MESFALSFSSENTLTWPHDLRSSLFPCKRHPFLIYEKKIDASVQARILCNPKICLRLPRFSNREEDSPSSHEDCSLLAAALTCAGAVLLCREFPGDDWFHLVGLIHDLGKILSHPAYGNEPQWAVVGDTFPVGCKHAPCIVHAHFFADNPDGKDERMSSEAGVYEPGCGLDKVHMSWGHDEYMYQVRGRAKVLLLRRLGSWQECLWCWILPLFRGLASCLFLILSELLLLEGESEAWFQSI